jgi:8-oxo-dGTP pyrophosphatase MutT (NUDIX family)
MTNERFKLIPAVYVILRKDNEVLLSRRANTGYQDGKYSLVAGHLEGDEVGTQAMVREAKEETGIIVNPSDLKFVHISHRLNRETPGQERIDIFYELWKWQGKIINQEPDKCIELKWFPINKLPEDIIPFIQNVLNNVEEEKYYSEYMTEPDKPL